MGNIINRSIDNLSESHCVIYKNTDGEGMFDYLLHFKAIKLGDRFLIIDYLGRGATVEVNKDEFKKNFLIIDETDFKEYEKYLNNGDTDLIEEYFEKIKLKYLE